MNGKRERQARLLEIIRGSQISTQGELVERLNREGIECTQASVSRDLRELGLGKRDGCYVEPPAAPGLPRVEELAVPISAFLQRAVTVGENLVVIHTISGTANSVAVYLDNRGWPGLAGTVAGDDTIFAAVEDRTAAESLVAYLEELRENAA